MNEKLLIDFKPSDLVTMFKGAFQLNSNFTNNPSFLVRPSEGNLWQVVGLADTINGSHYFPNKACPSCGRINFIDIKVDKKEQQYEIYCRQCGMFCHYIVLYKPSQDIIKTILNHLKM
jgi:hypothetical protein